MKLLISKMLSLPFMDRLSRYLWQVYVDINLSRIKDKSFKGLTRQMKQLDMGDETSLRDCRALMIVAQGILKDEVRIAEIGSWKGRTTAMLAELIKDFNGKLFAIDHWQGTPGTHHTNHTNVLGIFQHNMLILDLQDVVCPMIMDSLTAASIFKDNSLDLVFIDANHRYSQVKADIEAWWPKLRVNGILCGHDFELYYTEAGSYRRVINEHLEEEVLAGVCHPGVTRALYDSFQDRQVKVKDSSIWAITK